MYSSVEHRVARLLSRFPSLKRAAKYTYQRLTRIWFGAEDRVDTRFPIQRVFPDDDGAATFFGYYDHCPLSDDGRYVLVHRFNGETTSRPSRDDTVDVCVVETETGDCVFRTSSRAFNFQQGTRLQWVTNRSFVYNDVSDDGSHYVARQVDLDTNQEVTYAKPVQDSWKDHYFIALNYQRLYTLRPDYGYFHLPKLTTEELQERANDGLARVSYETGDAELIYSLDQICRTHPKPAFRDASHYVNHVNLSPDGERFIFLHRYSYKNRRFDRLFLGDPDGERLVLLADYDMVSHYCWKNDHSIVAYMRDSDGQDAYLEIDVRDASSCPFSSALDTYGDGHPSIASGRFVTDTYPQRSGRQLLLMLEADGPETATPVRLGAFYHGLDYRGEVRCDLHPRLTPNADALFFDSVFDGSRQMYRMNLSA